MTDTDLRAFYEENYPDWTIHALPLMVYIPTKDQTRQDAIDLIQETLDEGGWDIRAALISEANTDLRVLIDEFAADCVRSIEEMASAGQYGPHRRAGMLAAAERIRRRATEWEPLAAHPAPDEASEGPHIIHVTDDPGADDVVWCDECNEWALMAGDHPAPEASTKMYPCCRDNAPAPSPSVSAPSLSDSEPVTEPSDRGLSDRIDQYEREWLWREADGEHVARWGPHMGQMLYRLPQDGQTRDMQASIELMIADLRILAARLAAVEAERDQRRGEHGGGDFMSQAEWADWSNDLARLLPEWYDDDVAQEAIIERALADLVARDERAEAERDSLREELDEHRAHYVDPQVHAALLDRIAAVEALVDEWIHSGVPMRGDGDADDALFALRSALNNPGETLRARDERVWDEGYTSGHSNAMRRMSDEPNAPTTPNPYAKEGDR